MATSANSSAANAFEWSDEQETTASRNITVDDLRLQRQQLMQQQDKGLDILGEIITKQKYMAKGISTEIDAQNEILDDIHVAMDHTTDRLIRNTRNIKKVDRKSDSCCEYLYLETESANNFVSCLDRVLGYYYFTPNRNHYCYLPVGYTV